MNAIWQPLLAFEITIRNCKCFVAMATVEHIRDCPWFVLWKTPYTSCLVQGCWLWADCNCDCLVNATEWAMSVQILMPSERPSAVSIYRAREMQIFYVFFSGEWKSWIFCNVVYIWKISPDQSAYTLFSSFKSGQIYMMFFKGLCWKREKGYSWFLQLWL